MEEDKRKKVDKEEKNQSSKVEENDNPEKNDNVEKNALSKNTINMNTMNHIKDMPIKKSNKIIGWVLCIVLLFSCSVAVIQGSKSVYSDNDWVDYLEVSDLVPLNYVFYWRLQSLQNSEISEPVDAFVSQDIYEAGLVEDEGWSDMIYAREADLTYNTNINYLVLDDNRDSIVMVNDNSNDRLKQYIETFDSTDNKKLWQEKMQKEYGFYEILQYDHDGNITVLDSYGKEKNEILSALKYQKLETRYCVNSYDKVQSDIVTRYEMSDGEDFVFDGNRYVLHQQYEKDNDLYYKFVNVNSDEEQDVLVYKLKDSVGLTGIKDMTVVIAISEPGEYPVDYYRFYLRNYYYEIQDGYIWIFIAVLAIVALMACVFATVKSAGIATGFVSKIPIEFIIFICILLVYLIEPLSWLTRYHDVGILHRYLINANLSAGITDVMDYGFTYVCWLLYLGSAFICVVSVLSVFRKRLKRYLLENVWSIRIIVAICKACKTRIQLFMSLDAKNPINQWIIRGAIINFVILAVLCCFWFIGIPFLIIYTVFLLWYLSRTIQKQKINYDKIQAAVHEMSEGRLDHKMDEDAGIFTPLACELNKVQDGFKRAVQEEVKSQKMKTELITNVSHDLKTPLTAIITYVNLLKDENTTREQQAEYIEVLDSKSMRLKQLIEDLFEVSKINSSNVILDPVDVDVVELIKQAQLELSDRFEEAQIDFRLSVPEEKVILHLDSQRSYRIFENLFVNIVKYAQHGTRAYMTVTKEENDVYMVLKNISAQELNVLPEQLTERFVRGDESRNTEGSGLGLAIVKSIVEVQGGDFHIYIDGDLFKAVIHFRQ